MDSFPFNYTSSTGEKVRGIGGHVRKLKTCWASVVN